MNVKTALLNGILVGLVGAPVVAMFLFFDTVSAIVGAVIFLGLLGVIVFVMRVAFGGGSGGGGQQRATTQSKGARDR